MTWENIIRSGEIELKRAFDELNPLSRKRVHHAINGQGQEFLRFEDQVTRLAVLLESDGHANRYDPNWDQYAGALRELQIRMTRAPEETRDLFRDARLEIACKPSEWEPGGF